MFKYSFLVIGVLLFAIPAQAQQVVRPCTTQPNNQDCMPVSTANPLPVTIVSSS